MVRRADCVSISAQEMCSVIRVKAPNLASSWQVHLYAFLLIFKVIFLLHTVYNAWMEEHGGVIVNITAAVRNGLPGMS